MVLGALVYRLLIALALNSDFIGLKAQDLNLVTARAGDGRVGAAAAQAPARQARCLNAACPAPSPYARLPC